MILEGCCPVILEGCCPDLYTSIGPTFFRYISDNGPAPYRSIKKMHTGADQSPNRTIQFYRKSKLNNSCSTMYDNFPYEFAGT